MLLLAKSTTYISQSKLVTLMTTCTQFITSRQSRVRV